MFISAAVFLFTLTLIIAQPKGLKIGTSAVIGACIALVFGAVNFADVWTVTLITWDATLSFIGIIILSMALDEIGFFEYCALKMAHASSGSGVKLFVNMLILGAIVSALFANDGAALILTPIVLAKMRLLKLDAKAIFAFLLAGGFIGDSASNPLIISNLTNIVTAEYFNIGFFEYAQKMFLPNLISIIASIVVLWLFFSKSIPKTLDLSALPYPKSVIKNELAFKISWVFITLLLVGYFIGDSFGLPICVFALGGALLFLIITSYLKATKFGLTIKNAPWQIVWFSIGLYVVVYGLKNAGLSHYLSEIIKVLVLQGAVIANVGVGFMSAMISSVMNNMPTIMIMDIAINEANAPSLAYANILGCNLGPKMTPIGSLATLLWLHVLAQKGVKIGWGEYMKVGLVVTPPVLLAALFGLI